MGAVSSRDNVTEQSTINSSVIGRESNSTDSSFAHRVSEDYRNPSDDNSTNEQVAKDANASAAYSYVKQSDTLVGNSAKTKLADVPVAPDTTPQAAPEKKPGKRKSKKEMAADIGAAMAMPSARTTVSGDGTTGMTTMVIVADEKAGTAKSGSKRESDELSPEEERIAQAMVDTQMKMFMSEQFNSMAASQSTVVLDPSESDVDGEYGEMQTSMPSDLNEARGTTQARKTTDASSLSAQDTNTVINASDAQTSTRDSAQNISETQDGSSMSTLVKSSATTESAAQIYDAVLDKVNTLLAPIKPAGDDSQSALNLLQQGQLDSFVGPLTSDALNLVSASAAQQFTNAVSNSPVGQGDAAFSLVAQSIGEIAALGIKSFSELEVTSTTSGPENFHDSMDKVRDFINQHIDVIAAAGGDKGENYQNLLSKIEEIFVAAYEKVPVQDQNGQTLWDSTGKAVLEDRGLSQEELMSLYVMAKELPSAAIIDLATTVGADDPSLTNVHAFISNAASQSSPMESLSLSPSDMQNILISLSNDKNKALALDNSTANLANLEAINQTLSQLQPVLMQNQAMLSAGAADIDAKFFEKIRDDLIASAKADGSVNADEIQDAVIRTEELKMTVENASFDMRHSAGGRDDVIAM
ncbi:MAG: hypothetical protein ACRDAM_22270, partial [Casimicrobium sp.]